ncbi:MAG: hypothetical protein Q9212_002212, partial [Teloschistes hypoglaucus]
MLSIRNGPIARATGYRKQGRSATTRSDERRASILGANDEKSDRRRSSSPRKPFCGLKETDSPSIHSGASPRTSTEPGQCISSTNVSVVQNPFAEKESTKKETDSNAHAAPDYSPDDDNTWSSSPPHVRSFPKSKSVYMPHTPSSRITDSSIDLKPAYLDACQDEEDEALNNLLLQKEMNLHSYLQDTKSHEGSTPLQSAPIHTNDNPQPETPLLHHHCFSLQAADEAWLTTPLCLAVLASNVNLTQLFLKTGLVNVNSCCPVTRMTAMHLAAITPSPHSAEILSLLRTYGAVVDSQDAEGNTPLHRAITVPLTSSHEPNTTIPSSPTRYAAMIVKTLLRNNARVDIPNRRGQLPLTLAAQTLDLA